MFKVPPIVFLWGWGGGGFCVCSLCCYALLSALSSFIIILLRERDGKLVVLLYMSSLCLVTVSVLWLFLKVPWVGLQCVIVVFPDHTHILLSVAAENKANSFIFFFAAISLYSSVPSI